MRISDWSSDVCSSDLVAGGAELRFGTEAEAAPAGDVTVDCRGLAARDRLAELRGVRGEMLVLRSREVTLTRPVRLLHPRIPAYPVPRGEGRTMVGATMIESASDRKSTRLNSRP